jgi:predicted transcriptional regulator
VVGYAFVINGEINSADIYGSSALFRKVWNKLLDSAILEAIAESHRKTEAKDAVTQGAIRNWLEETEKGDVVDGEEVRPRLRVETRRSKTSILFDTRDHALGDAVLHRNCVTA